jgi:hypothetical protein
MGALSEAVNGAQSEDTAVEQDGQDADRTARIGSQQGHLAGPSLGPDPFGMNYETDRYDADSETIDQILGVLIAAGNLL